jgi:hypothetical protein
MRWTHKPRRNGGSVVVRVVEEEPVAEHGSVELALAAGDDALARRR